MSRAARWLGLVVLCFAGTAARAQDLTVHIKSLDDLLSAARFIAPLVEQEAFVKNLDQYLASQELREVFDTGRPLGMYATWPRGRDYPEGVIVFVPIRDGKALLAALRFLPLKLRTEKEIHELSIPGAGAVYFRLAKDHVFASPSAKMLEDAAKLSVPETTQRELVRATLKIKSIPGLFMLPPETKAMVTTLTVDLDQKKPALAIEAAYIPEPDSPAAAFAKEFAEGRSLFTGLHAKSLASISACINLRASGRLQDLGETMLRDLPISVPARQRALTRRLFKALQPTLENGVIDFGLAVYTKDRSNAPRVVGGVHLKEPRRLEHVLRDAMKELNPDDRLAMSLRWNYARYGTTRIHAALAQGAAKEADMFFGVWQDAAMIWGTELADVKERLDRLGPAGSGAAPIQVEVSPRAFLLSRFLAGTLPKDPEEFQRTVEALGEGALADVLRGVEKFMATRRGKDLQAHFSKLFPQPEDDNLRLKISVRADSALRARIDMHPHMLRLIPFFLK